MSWKENARLRAAVTEQTGTRHCRSCDKHRPAEGGKTRITANGRRIWRCKQCAERRNPGGFR
jgi:hypothetical protein